MNKFSSHSSVLIATFSPWKNNKRLPINGNLEPMRDFFVPRARKTVLIDQVYPDSDFVLPKTEIYENGKPIKILRATFLVSLLWPLLRLYNKPGTHIVYKVRDFFSVVFECLRHNEVFHYFIGFEAINAAAGILMKRFRRVKTVIYYVSDYSPSRYGNTWFNTLYVWLDRWCAKNVDVIWDVSPAMQPARIQAGLKKEESAPVIIVPNALYNEQIKKATKSEVLPFSLVFVGTFGVENGLDLAINALPLILEKFPKTSLHIYGGPKESENELKKIANHSGVIRQVKFHGFIYNRIILSRAISHYTVAVAPYRDLPNSVRKYADATKIRAYLAAGIPVVTTSVPPLGNEVARKGAALIVTDSYEALAKAVITLFNKQKMYDKMRKRAFEFAQNNTWNNEFEKAFRFMESLN